MHDKFEFLLCLRCWLDVFGFVRILLKSTRLFFCVDSSILGLIVVSKCVSCLSLHVHSWWPRCMHLASIMLLNLSKSAATSVTKLLKATIIKVAATPLLVVLLRPSFPLMAALSTRPKHLTPLDSRCLHHLTQRWPPLQLPSMLPPKPPPPLLLLNQPGERRARLEETAALGRA